MLNQWRQNVGNRRVWRKRKKKDVLHCVKNLVGGVKEIEIAPILSLFYMSSSVASATIAKR